MKIYIVEWRLFDAPNGKNVDFRKMFTSQKSAVEYADSLKAAAIKLGITVTPTVTTEVVE